MTTHEGIVDQLIGGLVRVDALGSNGPIPWAGFGAFSRRVHEQFEVPGTTLSPQMRRLLYAIGYASGSSEVLAIGSYVGYVAAFLVGGITARSAMRRITGIDPDHGANRLARINLGGIADTTSVHIIDGQAPKDLAQVQGQPDLILLDLDDPASGKRTYTDVLAALTETLPTGTVVAAHDACVPRFIGDFARYHEFVRSETRLRGPWVLPVDSCGLSIAVAA